MATASHQEPIDFAGLMPKVAELLLGQPNARLSRGQRLRFGNKGSLEIDTGEGWFSDHEASVSGGVLELIRHREGCDNAGAFRWLEDQGLKVATRFVGRPTSNVANDGSNRVKPQRIFYDYCDEDGATLFRVERRGKDAVPPFLQHGPDGNGGFHAARGCMQNVRRVLYRLPELLAADPAEIVFICEGEKDADRLAAVGLIATTNPGGAGKFVMDFALALAGRKVIVLQDNDEAGANHVAAVLGVIQNVAASATTLLLPGLPPKGDVSDWMASGGSAFELKQLAEKALSPSLPQWPALDLADCATRDAPPRRWVVGGWVPADKATLVAGDGGVGKSLMEQMKATCVAMGLPFLGLETRQAASAYLSWEDDAEELWRRQEAICDVLRIRMADLAGRLHLVSYTDVANPFVVTANDAHGIDITPLGRTIEQMVKQHKLGMLVLDNASQIAGIDHNSVEEVAPFAHWLGTLAKRCGGAVLLLHHTNKAGQDYLGSVAYNNQFRSRLLLARPVDCLDRDVRILTNPKANYAQAGNGITFRWFNGAFIRDEDLPDDIGAEIAAVAAANADDAAFLRCLAERTRQQLAVSEKTSSTFAPTVFATMPESRNIGKPRLEAAMNRLFRTGVIEREMLPWKRDRKDVYGLRLTCADGCADGAPTRCADAPDYETPTALNTHYPLKGEACAAIQAAAPAPKDDDQYGPLNQILAPGESPDDEVPGMEGF
jgi:RecA-family ATPase